MYKMVLLALLKSNLTVVVSRELMKDSSDCCGKSFREAVVVTVSFDGVEVTSDYDFLDEHSHSH